MKPDKNITHVEVIPTHHTRHVEGISLPPPSLNPRKSFAIILTILFLLGLILLCYGVFLWQWYSQSLITQTQVAILVANLTPTSTYTPTPTPTSTATPPMTATLRAAVGVCLARPKWNATVRAAPSYSADQLDFRITPQQLVAVTGYNIDNGETVWYRFYLEDNQEGLPNYWTTSDDLAIPAGCQVPQVDYTELLY
jgi:hypothetical protein